MTAIRYGNCRHLQINLNSCSFCVMIDQNLAFIKYAYFLHYSLLYIKLRREEEKYLCVE